MEGDEETRPGSSEVSCNPSDTYGLSLHRCSESSRNSLSPPHLASSFLKPAYMLSMQMTSPTHPRGKSCGWNLISQASEMSPGEFSSSEQVHLEGEEVAGGQGEVGRWVRWPGGQGWLDLCAQQ